MILHFTEGALKAIASKATRRKIEARGLRSVMEEAMLDIMYEMPSKTNIKEVIISKDVINSHKKPKIIVRDEKDEIKKVKIKEESA